MSIESLPAVPVRATVSNSITTQEFTYTGTPTLTGLTNKLTPFTFVLDTETTGVNISDDTIVWYFGDGESAIGGTCTHMYNWPGEYTVRVSYIDDMGSSKINSLKQTIHAYNYFNDSVWWQSPGIENCYLDQIIASRLSPKFTLFRTSSWQSYAAHETTGYTINLYVSGSDSAPLTPSGYTDGKYVHHQRTWRYVKDDDNRAPLTTIKTDSRSVYLKKSTTGEGFEETIVTDSDGVFVGTTGIADVHYIDDSPINLYGNNRPLFLAASLDMSRHGDNYINTIAINNGYYRDTGLDYFEHHRSVLPVKVVYNKPTRLLYTSNGIKQFKLSRNKLQGTSIPVTISLADDLGNIIPGYFPALSADFDGVDPYFIKLDLVPATGNPTVPVYKVWSNDKIPITTYGSYSGVLSSCGHTGCDGTVKLTGKVKVKDPSNYSHPEVTNIYIADVLGSELFNYRIAYRFPNRYSFLHKTTLSYNLPSIKRTTRRIKTPGMSAVLGIAINGRGEAWIADGDVDQIMKINTCGDVTYVVPVSTYIPGSDNTSPVGIAVDEESNFIFSCADTVSAFKVDGIDQSHMATLLPDVSNQVVLGNNTIQPGPIETRIDNTVLIGYTHPLSTFLCAYENDGSFESRHQLEEASHPVDILSDGVGETWVLGAGVGKDTGSLTHLDRDLNILHITRDIPMPGNLAMDSTGHIWFSYGANRIRKISRYTYRTMYDIDIGGRYDPPYDFISAIEGIANDLDGNILVIHNLDKKLYLIDSDNPFAKKNFIEIPSPAENRVQAFGDWTGGRWINKYGSPTTIDGGWREVDGTSDEFRIMPSDGCNNIAKFKEDYDAGGTLATYHLQPTIDNTDVWKNKLLNEAVGDYYSYPWELGKVIYEKIANNPANISDIQTANITSVYSLAESVDYKLEDYNYKYPARLKRLMDIVSIKHKKLFGDRSKSMTDFDHHGHDQNPDYAKNLGPEISIPGHIVTAGEPIVVNELYDNIKRVITPLVVQGNVTDPGYSSLHGGLTSYPLTSYTSSWGWGLSYPQSDSMMEHYSFYTFIHQYDNTQVEGIIDWSNWYTTLSESNSSYDNWLSPSGIVETMIDTTLKHGLGLVNKCNTGECPRSPHSLEVTSGVNISWNHSVSDRAITTYYRVLRATDGADFQSIGTVKTFASESTSPIVYKDDPPQCNTYQYAVEAINDWCSIRSSDPESVDIYVNDYHGLKLKFAAGKPTPTPTAMPIMTPTPRPTGASVMWQSPRAVYIEETKKSSLRVLRTPGSVSTDDIYVDVEIDILDVTRPAAKVIDIRNVTDGIYKIPAGERYVDVPVQAYGDLDITEGSEVYLVRIIDAYTTTDTPVTISGYDFSAVTIIPAAASVPVPTPTPTDYYDQFYLMVTPTPTDHYDQFYLVVTPTPTNRAEEFNRCFTPTPTPTPTTTPTPTPTPTPTYGIPCDVTLEN